MDQKKIGCFIAELRKEKKLTQTELGIGLNELLRDTIDEICPIKLNK